MDATAHFERMLVERGIPREWVDRVLDAPKRVVDQADGTRHYLGIIREFGGRWLRVVVAAHPNGPRLVTAFFDRRLGRSDED